MTSQFPRLFLWSVVRHTMRHPWLALLNVLSVGLGIAVYLAIQIANHSANRSFAAGVDLVAGKSHLEVRGDMDETLWPLVARQPGVRAVTGLVESAVTLPDFPGEYLRVLGIDIFSSEPFRTFQLSDPGQRLPLDAWLGAGDAIAISGDFARQRGLKAGDRLRVLVNAGVKTLRIISLLDTRDSPGASQSRIAAMDIGWAQELFGKVGRLSSLQILLAEPGRSLDRVAENLRRFVPANLMVAAPRQRSAQVETMLSAFELNLTALSTVSLLVGVFLIYNTISASVTRRRVEIGILRAIGATRGEVRALFLGEACLLGVIGMIAGAFGGVALARALTGAIAQTISAHYVLLSIERSFLDPWQFVVAAAFGIAAVLTGAWLPASDAARVDPVDALSLGAHAGRRVERATRWSRLAVAVLVAALLVAWSALSVAPPMAGFGAAFLVLCGFSLFAPGAVRLFGNVAGRLHCGVLWRLAAENLRRSVHRNGVTVAALATAIAMMVGLSVMIFSFRETVNAWVRHGIVADLFITPSSNETIGLQAAVPPAAIAWLRAHPGVDSVDTFREWSVPVRIGGAPPVPALLAVVGGVYRHNLSVAGGDAERRMERVFAGGAIAVSEPFARKFRVRAGDRLAIGTPRGEALVEIAAVYADYTRDQGVMLMSGTMHARLWPEPVPAQSLSIYLRAGAVPEKLAEDFRREFSRGGEFGIYSNRDLRRRIFAIFDQTFAVTGVLRTVALVVAIAGIFLSVTTLIAERTRDIGVLRAIGAAGGQVQRLHMIEAGMIGVIASALGIASGLALAMTLTWVVNPAFFGWTIHLQLPWAALATTPLWIIPATLCAAGIPAWRGSRTPIAEAVREE